MTKVLGRFRNTKNDNETSKITSMDLLRNDQHNTSRLNPQKGQAGLLRDKKVVSQYPLSKDTLLALEELGDVLKSIHRRMVSEGYELVDGVIRKKVSQM